MIKTDPYAGLDPDFAARVQSLIAASNGRVTLVSGFRSREQQQALWDAAVKKYGSTAEARKWVAPPGNSHHESGSAVDLGGDLELAAQLASQYGLTRPLKNEAWHFEPQGSRETEGFDQSGGTPQPAQDPFDPMAALADLLHSGSNMSEMGVSIPAPLPESADATASMNGGDTSGPGGTTTGDWKASLSPEERWIFTKESSLNPTAKNPTSTAFGIGQLLDYNRKKYLGADWETNDPNKQLTAARQYIKDRYGTAAQAKAFWEKNGYY